MEDMARNRPSAKVDSTDTRENTKDQISALTKGPASSEPVNISV